MKRIKCIIFCEGKTDQDLIGLYLERVGGWEFYQCKDSGFPKKDINWYRNFGNSQVLGIWQVGGNDFTKDLSELLEREFLEPTVEKVAIVTDYDDESAKTERLERILSVFSYSFSKGEEKIKCDHEKWCRFDSKDSFGTGNNIEFCYILVPINENGALETFMLNALSEKDVEKKRIVEKSRDFVDTFNSEVYLKQRRDKTKAAFGVACSIFCPDRSTSNMKELISSVDWDKYDTVNRQFKLLRQI